jgi:hypothetical protein
MRYHGGRLPIPADAHRQSASRLSILDADSNTSSARRCGGDCNHDRGPENMASNTISQHNKSRAQPNDLLPGNLVVLLAHFIRQAAGSLADDQEMVQYPNLN